MKGYENSDKELNFGGPLRILTRKSKIASLNRKFGYLNLKLFLIITVSIAKEIVK